MAIARMTRVFIVGPEDRQAETLRFLQEAGVMHLEPAAEVAGEFEKQNTALLVRVRKLDQLIKSVGRFRDAKAQPPSPAADEELASFAEERLVELQGVESRMASLERLRVDLLPWGDFDPRRVRGLEEAGVVIRRYRMDEKHWHEVQRPGDCLLEVVAQKPAVLFYTLSLGEPPEIPQATPLPWPELGLAELEAELRRLAERRGALTGELSAVAARADVLKKQMIATLNEANYAGHMAALRREPYLFGLQGWVPATEVKDLREKAAVSGLPLRIVFRRPLETEEPPVLLKNNWLIQRIEPLLKLYGVPNYREFDPSYFFAPFMILFFGICLSDAGYGLVFFLLSLWLEKKLGPKIEGLALVMKLCQAFALATIAVGLLTGSIFGYSFQNRQWILIDVAVGVGNPMIFFYLALGLGVLQLSIAYILGALQAPTWHGSLQKLGLMAVLWGGVLLISRNIWFASPDTLFHLPLYYGGIACLAAGVLITLLFSSDDRRWGLRLGMGLWSVYGLTSLIGDLLSYARLFGLGIATSAIAAVMNQLAGMVFQAAGPVLGGFFGLLIIILGHAFNLLLSLLGSTVHSARLHFVEAFKNFYRGGGTDYQPFRIERG